MKEFRSNGMYAKVLAHSRNEEWSAEAASFEVRFPRIILAEFNTHKLFVRNSASSRAIPLKKLIADIRRDMFLPSYWGKNQSGMQAREELTGFRLKLAKNLWYAAGYGATVVADVAGRIGLHKQITNRIIENFGYVTVVFTTTNLSNFFALRNHADAQPEIKVLAGLIIGAIEASTPRILGQGEWHLPYVTEHERSNIAYSPTELIAISVSRCASTSFKTVDGKIMTAPRAIELFDKLLGSVPLHASPAEHQLTPDIKKKIDIRDHGTRTFKTIEVWSNPEKHGAMKGFIQYRKTLNNEFVGPSVEGRLY